MTSDGVWGDDYGGANASGWQRVADAMWRRGRGLGRWAASVGRDRWPIETLANRLARSIQERLQDAQPLSIVERNALQDLQPLLPRIGWRSLLPAVVARLGEEASATASPRAGTAPWRSWAHRIEQAIAEVEASFRAEGSALPERIHPEDGRLLCVIDWIENLLAKRQTLCLADVGCGNGRFFRALSLRFPQVKFVGIDPAPPEELHQGGDDSFERGSLPDLPWNASSFDGAFAIETLEHCLFPQAAVRELCRIIRPGGGLLIIDKCRRYQWLSDHQPWEQWFWPSDLAQQLASYCHAVDCQAISHGPPESISRNLFLRWRGCVSGRMNDLGK